MRYATYLVIKPEMAEYALRAKTFVWTPTNICNFNQTNKLINYKDTYTFIDKKKKVRQWVL